MSEFDKEAERERLREKYERDQQKRETTEKMSELLLQGATMTNAHCSECNAPIFRYDGQEFCPTCEKAIERAVDGDAQDDAGAAPDSQDGAEAAGDGNDGVEAAGDGQDDAASIEVTSPSDEARVSFGGDGEAAPPAEDADGSEHGAGDESEAVPEAGDEPVTEADQSESPPAREQAPTTRSAPASTQSRPPRHGQPAGVGVDEQYQQAHDSLVRTLVRFSERAEAADDPRRAREHLAAAREAAETLDALR